MIPAILLVFLLFFGAIVKHNRRLLYDGFSVMLSEEEYLRRMRLFAARSNGLKRRGQGVDAVPLKNVINRAYGVIARKVKRGDSLFEYEKWLYDNHGFIIKYASNEVYDAFYRLPHIEGLPRVIAFARKIVAYCNCSLTKERLETALAELDKTEPLQIKEGNIFKYAIAYALLEKLAAVSAKCLHYRRFYLLAVKTKNFVKRFAASNVYVYYALKNNAKIAEKLKTFLKNGGKNYDNVDYVFSALIIENNILTAKAVRSLLELDNLSADILFKLPVNKILETDDIYRNMDTLSKEMYLNKISNFSDKLDIKELEFAKKLLELQLLTGKHFGELLFDYPRAVEAYTKHKITLSLEKAKNKKTQGYIAVNSIISFLLCAVTLYFMLSKGAYVYYAYIISAAFLPLMWIAYLPLSAYIADNIYNLFVKPRPLCRMSYPSVPNNAKTLVTIAVYAPSRQSLLLAIEKIKRLAAVNGGNNIEFVLLLDFKASADQIDESDAELIELLKTELENSKDISALVRKRVKNRNGKYSGYERKRGAIEALNAYFYDFEVDRWQYIDKDLQKPEYIVILDIDNELTPQSVLRAVNVFLHPFNRGFDLLSFDCRINLFSIKSGYSKRFYREGGVDNYPEFGNLLYNLTGSGIFCGKGIYRLSAFYEKLNQKLPENKILSHDILEGGALNTGAAGVCVYEDAPSSFISEANRRMRWQRGDIQLLPFLKGEPKISLIYKWLIFKNAFGVLSMFGALVMVLFGILLPSYALTIGGLSAVALGYVFTAFWNLMSAFKRRIKFAFSDFIRNLLFAIESLVLLPYYGISAIVVFIGTIAKMANKGDLLSWKTFSEVQKPQKIKNKIIYFDTIMEYAKKTYAFFDNTVNSLPHDNIAISPKNKKAEYTSPTNIGFAMLAHVSAAELGIISIDEAERRVEDVLLTVLKLEKWRGHLYNWYDINTLKPLAPEFVSSVDSGNFVASLFVVSRKFGGKIQKIAEKLIKYMNFGALYDYNKQQFYIGFNKAVGNYEGHYDLSASEARLLSYIAVSLGLSVDNWYALSRRVFSSGSNVLASWNGTAFEYLMPEIFLSEGYKTLYSTTAVGAVDVQIKSKCSGLWGISESGKYEFDDLGNYTYEAFGIDRIAIKSFVNACVISPYSTFLCLKYRPRAAVKNLKELEKRGMTGEYGFYEALDCSLKDTKIVAEYMAHHQGMSIAAMTDYLTGGAIRKLFFEDFRTSGARMLLNERPIESRGIKKPKTKFYRRDERSEGYHKKVGARLLSPVFNVLKSGNYGIAIDDYGSGFSVYDGININRFRKNPLDDYGAYFYVLDVEKNELIQPTYAPMRIEGNYNVSFSEDSAVFNNGDIELRVNCPDMFDGEYRRLTIKNSSNSAKLYKIFYFVELALSSTEDDNSHATFNNLFIKTSCNKRADSIYHIRAKRRCLSADGYIYGDCVVKGIENFNAVTNRYNFIGRGRTVANPKIIKDFKPMPDDTGDVLEPCIGFVGDVVIGANRSAEIEVITSAARDIEKADLLVKRACCANFGEFLKEIPFVIKNKYPTFSKDQREYICKMFSELIYRPYTNTALVNIAQNSELYSRISSNFCYKLLYYEYKTGQNDELSALVEAIKLFNFFGANCSLVIAYKENDDGKSALADINATIKSGIIGRDIIIINSDSEKQEIKSLCFSEFNGFTGFNQSSSGNYPTRTDRSGLPDLPVGLKTGEGGFNGDIYNIAPFKGITALPYCNVVCDKKGGTVLTNNGGGYTYFGNSREDKYSVHSFDPVSDKPSEWLWLIVDGKIRRLNGDGARVSYAKGAACYQSLTGTTDAAVEEYMISNGAAKVFEVKLKNASEKSLNFDLILSVDLALGWREENDYIKTSRCGCVLEAVNVKNGKRGFIKGFGAELITEGGKLFSRSTGRVPSPDERQENIKVFAAKYSDVCTKYDEKIMYFVLSADYSVISDIQENDISNLKKQSLEYFKNLNPFSISTSDIYLDKLFNDCLYYQLVSSRINGKCAFYQTGGATGFRDKLQDVLALLYSEPNKVREQIIESAAHQYEEGDVQHWWHEPRFGVRTRISDDKLFLPYVTAIYIKATGDKKILKEKICYLNSNKLASTENSRYEYPEISQKCESLSDHIVKAIDNAYVMGVHGLLRMGSGDWNDALDAAGGESVWLSMFCYKVLNMVIECGAAGKRATEFAERAENLKTAVAKCFENGYFKRLYTGNGEWLGARGGRVEIDLISQAWASLSDITDSKRALSALETANELVDIKNGLIKLLWPPALDEGDYLGYIQKYPYGVRENGGQYTHGAVWYIAALLKEGKTERAYELIKIINPIEKCADTEKAKIYKGEPYVLSGDVYANPIAEGRAGWSWYTGSAAWMYTTIISGLFGIVRYNGNIKILPRSLPQCLDGAKVIYRADNSVYNFRFERSDKRALFIDGVKIENGYIVKVEANIMKNITINYV